ncbi:hypothetical protein FKK78_11955 [Enterobacter hormaechei]|nr:hypothetical protein [Enterobacter hormaechei]RTP17929.1 hypothetical protein EKN48_01600 [Enterobacter hormaechei]TYR70214.1 hypothetical protein FYK35_08920 [Enterobacter hormaechei]
MLDVVIVIRHANHHFSGLAQVLTCFGKGVKHKSFLTCSPHPGPLPKGERVLEVPSPLWGEG